MNNNIFYICDCKKACSSRTSCYKNSGPCKYINDQTHAKYGPCEDNSSDFFIRFEAETFKMDSGNTITYFWEKEITENAGN